jgi:hypothetical protein
MTFGPSSTAMRRLAAVEFVFGVAIVPRIVVRLFANIVFGAGIQMTV